MALLQAWCVLFSLPAQQGWNAWERHYCALTRPTVNGEVKVPFEMYVTSKEKKKQKKTQNPREHNRTLVHVLIFHITGSQSTVTTEEETSHFSCLSSTYSSNRHSVIKLHNIPARHIKETHQQ